MAVLKPTTADPMSGILPRPLTEEGRPRVRGKFIVVGGQKPNILGMTYGPFRTNVQGSQYHTPIETRPVHSELSLVLQPQLW